MKLTLESIIRHILNEDVSSDNVLDAIKNKYHVRIRYDDGKESNGGNPKGSRIIQPFAVGTTKKGYPVVRAFQVSGNSRRGAPKWKFFRLDRITSWKPMRNKKFYEEPDISFGEYNKVGDRTMGFFTDNVKFGDMNDPLERMRAKTQGISSSPKVSTKNMQGPVTANQQWKKNVFTSQPNSEKYSKFARNVNDTSHKTKSYWDDYEKASQEVRDQQNQVPKPNVNDSGPVRNKNNEDFYDVTDVDFDENNFIDNTNKR